MIKKVVIAACEENVRKLARSCLERTCKGIGIEEVMYKADLYRSIDRTGELLVIFDKYFFGYDLCHEILKLRVRNKDAHICFVECGDCSRYFGLRLYEIGVKSYITNIEDYDHFRNEFLKVVGGAESLPNELKSSIESSDYLLDRKCFTEITEKELVVGLYLGEGKSQKEICYITGMSQQTVNIHVHRLKRKIGYKEPGDYAILNRRAFFNCCV